MLIKCSRNIFWESVQLYLSPEMAWKAKICLLTNKTSEELEDNIPYVVLDVVIPLVWASKELGKAKNLTLIKIEQKQEVWPVGILEPFSVRFCGKCTFTML